MEFIGKSIRAGQNLSSLGQTRVDDYIINLLYFVLREIV